MTQPYDPEQQGWQDGYWGRVAQVPERYSDEYIRGYEDGQLDRLEKDEWISELAVEMAVAADVKRRAS